MATRWLFWTFIPMACVLGPGVYDAKSAADIPGRIKMKLHSPAFAPGAEIPPKYTCDGENVSPPLTWDSVPKETKALALICDDPDAPARTWVHWVLFDVPPELTALSEHQKEAKTLPNGSRQGINDFSRIGYGGPCPPSGTHRYYFKLYALDKILALSSGATKEQVLSAMEGHVLETAELMGRYHRAR